MIVCQRCSAEFESPSGRGRPRKFCFDCAPRKVVDPRPKVQKVCAGCGVAYESVNNSRFKYCSRECRDLTELRRPCLECGSLVWVGRDTPKAGPTCRSCRAPVHGEVAMYEKRGCRCDRCRGAKNEAMRQYAAARRESGRPVGRVKRDSCEFCGTPYIGTRDSHYCSAECAKKAQGWDGVSARSRKLKASVRVRILDRDGMTCQLCFSPLRPDEEPTHPRYPNIDHIMPVSHGGSDGEDNLRAACRQCNVSRGANIEWVPEVVDHGGFSAGNVGVAV